MNASPYTTLVEISSLLADVELFDVISHDCIDDATALLQRIRPILNRTQNIELQKCVVPVEYKADFFAYHADQCLHLQYLARALRFAADVAAFQGEYETVAQYGNTILNLANAVRRGGIVVDHLVAIAISGSGVSCLRSVRDHFTDDLRHELIAALQRNELEREPFSEIAERDARWEADSGYEPSDCRLQEDELLDPNSELSIEQQHGLIQLVNNLIAQPESEMQALHADLERRALAMTRLLAVDLALRCWRDRIGRWPRSIADLAPDVVSSVPLDPFTDDDFIYVPSGNSFLLYSTGPDRTDSGGKFGSWPAVAIGGCDLCLDFYDY